MAWICRWRAPLARSSRRAPDF